MECCRIGCATCSGVLLWEGPAVLDEACLSANSSTVSLPVVPLAPEASILPLAALVAIRI